MSLGNIVLKGYSPTILMDSAPHTQSFGGRQSVNTAIIADRIIKEALGTSKFDFRIDPQNKGYINYSSQYCETHYNYLARLAEAYGEQFYYDGYVLHFGKLPPPSEKPIQLIYGSNVTDVQVELKAVHTKPEHFGYNSSSHAKMNGSNNEIKHLGDLSSKAYELNDNIFRTRSLTPTPINANMFLDVDDSQKSARGSKAVEVFTVSGKTTVPFLFIGCVADIDMRNQDSNQTSHFTTLMMTEVSHEVDARGYYIGIFEAIAEGTGFMPKPDFVIPKAEPQVATVISNADPLNQGRIQVQFDWQLNDTTHFIRMMSPDAGGTDAVSQNRGLVTVPEIGDQVMVNFEYHNPDFPFAMGGMFHGGVGLGGGMDNRVKSLQTRSGHRLVFTEDESILLTDKSGNELRFDTKGSNINITAHETITIKSKNLKFYIEENIETKAGKNMDTNVGQNIKIIAKQEISQDSGKKTIINAGTNTEISARAHLDLYGKEKFIGYTDGQTEFGAKDRMHVYGANSLLTAKDKIEYKAPQMNKLPQNGEFDYTKEKQIVSAQWMDADMNKEIAMASYDEEISLLVYTRNYEEGESITLTVYEVDDKDINNGEKEITLTGNVKKDGFAELKRSVKVEKQQA
ncbi:phage baseplate assembly protein V [Chryseobacterium bernardetii]|uniref:phage baseplate assembly protein V n=1 Tax=Chryseobacterium bernardetii TaxID=1241978 RepID=UPI001628C46B|nr:phage baseplate assembly protein V [Chryseobacterium bernardetii]